ncbi:MAG: CRTAC1 family protein [Vicinamibacteria bacterium]|nr:CRTAC1 family protein [Vicinamibacteria bacterium]
MSRRQRRTLGTAAACGVLLVAVAAVALSRREVARYDPAARPEGITSTLERALPDDYPRVTFTDSARETGLTFRHFPGERSTQLPEDMGSGAAWGDFDDDGDDDLFLVNVSGPLGRDGHVVATTATSRLFRNEGGRFMDVSREAGVAVGGVGMAAAWGDADGDGRLDLVVTSYGRLWLFRNRGDGTFEDRSTASGFSAFRGFWAGASWADYDRDGDLDLYICGYVRYQAMPSMAAQTSVQFEAEVPFALNPASFPAERNLLLRNDGRGRFVDVAEAAGVDNRGGRSLSAAWADFDDDGWLDLYVANDISDNALFRNLGEGVFEDISHASWVADPRGAMGLAVGDWDLDGDFDIFVTHWLAQENALFSNQRVTPARQTPGRLTFMDAADQKGVGQISLDYVKWGTAFFDYDNDGRLDLLSVNGSTFQDPADQRRLIPMPHQLFWNRDDREGFYEVGGVSGAVFTKRTVGRGAAVADYDNDGDLDVVVVNHGGETSLLRNDGGTGRRWLKVRVRGSRSRFAFGALVTVTTADGVTQRQQIGAQPSYLSQHSLTAHFGLGPHDVADQVVVRFLGGREARRTGVRANQTITIEEGGP